MCGGIAYCFSLHKGQGSLPQPSPEQQSQSRTLTASAPTAYSTHTTLQGSRSEYRQYLCRMRWEWARRASGEVGVASGDTN